MRRIHLVFGLDGECDVPSDALFLLYEACGAEAPAPSDCCWMIPGTWIED